METEYVCQSAACYSPFVYCRLIYDPYRRAGRSLSSWRHRSPTSPYFRFRLSRAASGEMTDGRGKRRHLWDVHCHPATAHVAISGFNAACGRGREGMGRDFSPPLSDPLYSPIPQVLSQHYNCLYSLSLIVVPSHVERILPYHHYGWRQTIGALLCRYTNQKSPLLFKQFFGSLYGSKILSIIS